MEHIALTKYTNHYYIGSERIASALGTLTQLGILCEQVGDPGQALINRMDNKVDDAGTALKMDHTRLGKTLILKQPFHYNGQRLTCDLTVYPDMYAAFWYHPDHLGSSSYITNLDGEITQHMEYLPFGETLVEEHLNSNNSPFKFNAKEFDSETGNYYYGARYYNPKWSLWLSVDPLAEQYAPYSPYSFVANNPINNQEVDGRWWFSKNKKNKANPYGRVAHSQYAFKMSSVRAVHKKQTGWASYIPTIGNFLNGSAMIQKLEDPSMSLDKGDIASLFLGGYFKGTRKLVKAAGDYQGAAKTALKLSEEFTTLTQSIASSPELKESWVELAVMKHFAGATSDGGNIIGTLTGTQETDYTTMFTFSEDFVGELQGVYGNEFDALKDTSGMSRESYIENKVQGHIQQMFESKKTEIMKQFDE